MTLISRLVQRYAASPDGPLSRARGAVLLLGYMGGPPALMAGLFALFAAGSFLLASTPGDNGFWILLTIPFFFGIVLPASVIAMVLCLLSIRAVTLRVNATLQTPLSQAVVQRSLLYGAAGAFALSWALTIPLSGDASTMPRLIRLFSPLVGSILPGLWLLRRPRADDTPDLTTASPSPRTR